MSIRIKTNSVLPNNVSILILLLERLIHGYNYTVKKVLSYTLPKMRMHHNQWRLVNFVLGGAESL